MITGSVAMTVPAISNVHWALKVSLKSAGPAFSNRKFVEPATGAVALARALLQVD